MQSGGKLLKLLGVPKDDANKKWKSLLDTYVRQKNIKAKSGDGLSDSKPRWKYYAILLLQRERLKEMWSK